MDLPVRYDQLRPWRRKTVRDEYVRRQNGLCHHCKEPLDGPPSLEVQNKKVRARLFPRGFLDHPVHLHHDHKTLLTLGAVHARCNAVLWQYHGE